jgi:3-oxoacyl-[acyl-carrier-protein] synthase-1
MRGALEIVAVAARTPVGSNAESSAAAVRADISRLRESPFIGAHGEPLTMAVDPRLEEDLEGVDRLLPLLGSVLDEIGTKLRLDERIQSAVQVWLALPEARPGFSDADAALLRQHATTWLAARGVQGSVRIGGRGHAGVIECLDPIATLDPRQRTALTLLVGLDSYRHPETIRWLHERRKLAGPDTRAGFIPGEAGGCLAIAESSRRAELALPSLATIRGVGTAQEEQLAGSATGSFGVGLTRSVERAAANLSLPGEAADTVYCDINGERYRTEEWGFFALRAPYAYRSSDYVAPCTSWGDVGAASGALLGMLAVQGFARGYAAGPRALVMTGSEGGARGALFLDAP